MNNGKNYILSKEIAGNKLSRMALEIVERNYDEKKLILLGIKENGPIIAAILANHLKKSFSGEIQVGSLSMDKKRPGEVMIEPSFSFDNEIVILIDDVVNSGKAFLYALKPLLAAYPKKIQTAALVERTHKSFPVALDYVGLSVSTTLDEHIFVEVENNEVQGAWMEIK